MNLIRAFGFNAPVCVSRAGRLLCGHARIAAAKRLGFVEVSAIRVGYLGLRARVFALAGNRSGEMAAWDAAPLQAEIAEI